MGKLSKEVGDIGGDDLGVACNPFGAGRLGGHGG